VPILPLCSPSVADSLGEAIYFRTHKPACGFAQAFKAKRTSLVKRKIGPWVQLFAFVLQKSGYSSRFPETLLQARASHWRGHSDSHISAQTNPRSLGNSIKRLSRECPQPALLHRYALKAVSGTFVKTLAQRKGSVLQALECKCFQADDLANPAIPQMTSCPPCFPTASSGKDRRQRPALPCKRLQSSPIPGPAPPRNTRSFFIPR